MSFQRCQRSRAGSIPAGRSNFPVYFVSELCYKILKVFSRAICIWLRLWRENRASRE